MGYKGEFGKKRFSAKVNVRAIGPGVDLGFRTLNKGMGYTSVSRREDDSIKVPKGATALITAQTLTKNQTFIIRDYPRKGPDKPPHATIQQEKYTSPEDLPEQSISIMLDDENGIEVEFVPSPAEVE